MLKIKEYTWKTQNIPRLRYHSTDEAQDAVIIIDQTLLPGKIELIALHTAQEMWDAIYLLKVRGARPSV